MKKLTSCFLLSLCFLSSAQATEPEELGKLFSPYIVGDTLVFKGRIDSHFYDFLSREARAIEKVKKIELNSLGGNHSWALEVAKKIKQLGKTTVLPKGNLCASACVYIFSAGQKRLASEENWFGVHGARLGGGWVSNFQGSCFVELEDGPALELRKKGCQDFLRDWQLKAMTATTEAFDFMEGNGVSPAMRETYFAMPDDEKWFEQANVIRKPDWFLVAGEAVKFNLVTAIEEVASVDESSSGSPRAD